VSGKVYKLYSKLLLLRGNVNALSAVCAAICFSAQPLKAQVPPDPSNEQRRQQERQDAERQRQQPLVDVRVAPPETTPTAIPTLIPSNELPCFPIQQVQLSGNDAAQFTWLLDHLAGAAGNDSPLRKCVGANGINVLLKRAQDALVERGYVTSRVLAQPQDISQGLLTLSVIAGRIREIRYAQPDNSRNPTRATLPLRSGDILNLRDVEQALENLKRVPTAEADIKIEPGQAPGESDLVISYAQKNPFRMNLSVDDSGSKGSGVYQGALTLSYDNWWTASDLFYLTLNHDLGGGDPGSRGTKGHSAHYSIPMGYWTLAFNGSASSYFQTVAGATQDYIYSGNSANADVKLSRLVYRDASRKLTVSLRGFARASKNFIDDTEVQVQRRKIGGFELGANYREFIGRGTLDTSLNYKRGTGAFGSLPSPEEAFGEGTSRFKLITADINYSLPFKMAEQNLRWNSNWRAQWNRTPLTPQDRFSIGSRYSVRGFNGENSLSAERGFTWRNELAAALGESGQEAYLALDHGRVGGPSSDLLVGKQLTGMAIGVRGGWKGLQYDIFVGRPLSKPDNFRASNTTGGFNLNYSF
jgi:hemolysin activation/secretion protein